MTYDFFDDIHMAITFEFDLTFYRMERTAYNILDWIGDIGGLEAALLIFFAAFYGFLHYKSFDNFLVQKLYRNDEEDADQQQDRCVKDDSEDSDSPILKEGEFSCFVKRIVRYKCCTCNCLRTKSKKYKLLRKGRHNLGAETDIVKLLK